MAISGDARKRLEGSDLVQRLTDPGFTPSVRMVGELFQLFEIDDETVAKNAERAALRIDPQHAARVAREVIAAVKRAERPARARLTHVVGRLAQTGRDPDHSLVEWLLEALADADPKTRRVAARALGKLPLPPTDERASVIEKALANAFDAAKTDDDKRALALALGKVGGDTARARLVDAPQGRASIIAERDLARRAPGAIDVSGTHEGPLPIWFHTRSGLEDVLKEELLSTSWSSGGPPRFVAPGVVEAKLEGALSRALRIRTAVHVGFPLAPAPKGTDLAADIVRGICSAPALDIFRAFTSTEARIRFRVAFVRGGHRRSIVWRCAELVRAASSELVNDPKESTWEVLVDEAGGQVKIELVPRGYTDERFGYREDLVAASSHPVIAAALARVAPRSDEDVVWDPFVGAGAELVERGLLGRYRQLLGTDTDPRAVVAARANIERAGIERATISEANACELAPKDVNVILTNPPMGRRVERGGHLELLERFVTRAADVLVPGGALVWLVPEPEGIRARAEAAGLTLDRAFTVDMGGFSAELSTYVKRTTRSAAGAASPKRRRPRR
jgi:23S rRNA G2445 N2-methylase RlmL